MQAAEKKNENFLCGTLEIFAFIRFGIAWTGPDKSEIFLGYNISFLSISCFPTKKDNGNFPLLYVVKMSLRRWVGGSKKPQNTLT